MYAIISVHSFYDDFIMRFDCKNVLYDLANGGGKSVLLLLFASESDSELYAG